VGAVITSRLVDRRCWSLSWATCCEQLIERKEKHPTSREEWFKLVRRRGKTNIAWENIFEENNRHLMSCNGKVSAVGE